MKLLKFISVVLLYALLGIVLITILTLQSYGVIKKRKTIK